MKHYKNDLEFQCFTKFLKIYFAYIRLQLTYRFFFSENKCIKNIKSMFKTDV